MQHAGLQYGQGAANSHQSPPFAHTDISQSNGGNTASSLRQFRKKDSIEKNSNTDLNSVENSHIARVPPHNHYPARPNDYYRYHHQFPEYNSPFKENPAPVKYSEIAETPPQPLQHVDHIPSALQKHKEPHKEFMDMCNLTQSTHMKQNYPETLNRQQSYPPDTAVHHQYIHKDPQVHPSYKPESQYQQYHPSQIPKYNMPNIPSQCRKYPPHENEFLAKLQRINPSMARSIISDHHMRDPQAAYSGMDQARMYQNQRYFPNHMQNNPSYNYHNMPQPYYPSSCNYPRSNQMSVGGAQYPGINPHSERSLSPRNMNMGMNYGAPPPPPPQKVSPNYGQYNPPEYAQHYQHRRTSMPQEYYQQQPCRTTAYMQPHQLPPETADNRPSSGIRHFIENWAEEEGPGESLAPIFKDSVRLHNDASNEHVFVIESSTIPQLENVALVPTENGQYIIKSGIDNNSVVRIEKPNEDITERAVNLQIVESNAKTDCMLLNENIANEETANPVPYKENQINTNCDEKAILNESCEAPIVEKTQQSKKDTIEPEPSVIVCNEVSVIKDMPLIDEPLTLQVEEHRLTEIVEPQTAKNTEKEKAVVVEEKEKTVVKEIEKVVEEREERIENEKVEKVIAEGNKKDNPEHIEELVTEAEESAASEEKEEDDDDDGDGDNPAKILEKELLLTDNHITSSTKRTQRIFSVDDIINTAGAITSQTRRNSLQCTDYFDNTSSLSKEGENKEAEKTKDNEEKANEEVEEEEEEATYTNAISVEENSIILEIGGALVQLNLNHYNGTKVLSVLPLSESLVIDVNGNLQDNLEAAKLGENTAVGHETAENTAVEHETAENTAVEHETAIEGDKLKSSNAENLEDKHESQCDILQEDMSQSESTKDDPTMEETATLTLEDEMNNDVYHSEIIIGDDNESSDNDIFINLESTSETTAAETNIPETILQPIEDTVEQSKCDQHPEVHEHEATNLSDCDEIKICEEDLLKLKEEAEAEESETIEERLKQFETTVFPEKNLIEEALVEEKIEDISIKIESPIIKQPDDRTSLQERFTEKSVKPLEVVRKKEKKSSREEKKKSKERSEEKKKSSSSLKNVKGDEKHKRVSKKNGENTSKSEKKSKSDGTVKLSKTTNQDKKESENKIENVSSQEICLEKEKPIEKEKRVEREKPAERAKHVEKEIPVERERPIIHHVSTKAAKKLYENDIPLLKLTVPTVERKTLKRKSKIEEAVTKIKLLKKEPDNVKVDKSVDKEETAELFSKKGQKRVLDSNENINIVGMNENKEAIPLNITKPCKRVTFSLDTEIREMGKEEMDRKKLSWEEYHSRKRQAAVKKYEWGESTSKIMEDTVSSTKEISDDVIEEVALSIEKEIETSTLSKSPPRVLVNNWEDPDSPEMVEPSSSSRQKKCFIDINEFSIKPIESVSTPSPVSSSQFSYHSEDDSLQVYKNVVDSKLNSLNITIPKKVNKPKPVEHFSVLFDRFLNKGTLNGSELEKVRKIIELKRKMIEEQQLTYEVRAERELKDLKLHLKKVPEKRKHKRFRNLYADDTSDDSDSSRSEKEIGDYSVYQRNSQQGVPKLIIKRKSGLPQPFVKLERSHAVDLLAKKRKLY